MIDWLRKNKDSLSIRGIERQLNMPDSTLIKAVNGSQKLPKKWEKPLRNYIKRLCRSGLEEKKNNTTDVN